MLFAWRNEKCRQIFIVELNVTSTLEECSCKWENNIKMAVQQYVLECLRNAEWPVCEPVVGSYAWSE